MLYLISVIAWIIASGLGGSGLILALVNGRIARNNATAAETQRAENSREIEKLRSDLTRIEQESKTKFDWLHRKRASAIIELYATIVQYDSAMKVLTSGWYYGDAEEQKNERIRRWKDVIKSGADYRALFSKYAIFFESDVVSIFRKLDSAYWKKSITFNTFKDAKTPEERERLIQTTEFSEEESIIEDIQQKLRSLLGVIESGKETLGQPATDA